MLRPRPPRCGNVSPASIGIIQRGLLALENQGAAQFFGEPMLDIADLMRQQNGKGVVSILAAEKLMNSPKLYSTFLLWMLAELFEHLPEVGDPEQPKLELQPPSAEVIRACLDLWKANKKHTQVVLVFDISGSMRLEGRMVNAKTLGELNTVVSEYSEPERRLRLRFPDGKLLEGEVRLGEEVETRFYSRTASARLVEGDWSQALSELVGRPLRLVEAGDQGAVDRGAKGAVSLISVSSLQRLAGEGGYDGVDSRRFRMLIEVEGVGAHAEDAWVGRSARIGGSALVRFELAGKLIRHSGHALVAPTLTPVASRKHVGAVVILAPALEIVQRIQHTCPHTLFSSTIPRTLQAGSVAERKLYGKAGAPSRNLEWMTAWSPTAIGSVKAACLGSRPFGMGNSSGAESSMRSA